MVGVTGFEPATSSSRTPRSSRMKPCLRWPARIWMKPNVLDGAPVAVLHCSGGRHLRVRRSGQTFRGPARRFLVGWRRQLPGEPGRSADANCCQKLRITSRKRVVHQVLAPRGRRGGCVEASMIAQSVGCARLLTLLAWEAGGATVSWCPQPPGRVSARVAHKERPRSTEVPRARRPSMRPSRAAALV